jgi:hypothetical protein
MTSRTVHANRAGLTILILLLYFLSGATGLSFEVLWFKDLRLLFGSTAYASSTVVAVFFLGISAGSFFWGRILPRYSSPIMVYGWLELGVALFSLPYLALLKTYLFIYPTILSLTGDNFFIATIIKFLLAALLLFPSTFLMGGTFPAISQFLVRLCNQYNRCCFGSSPNRHCNSLLAWLPHHLFSGDRPYLPGRHHCHDLRHQG